LILLQNGLSSPDPGPLAARGHAASIHPPIQRIRLATAAGARGRPTIRTSDGWIRPDRAPALRRAADLLATHIEQATSPNRASRLVREMRIRAAELELAEGALDAGALRSAKAVFRETGRGPEL